MTHFSLFTCISCLNGQTCAGLWFSDQKGSVLVVWQHEQLYGFAPADACEQPPVQTHDRKRSAASSWQQKLNLPLFSVLEISSKRSGGTFPAGGGLRAQGAEAGLRLAERIELLFQMSVSADVKVDWDSSHQTRKPPHLTQLLCFALGLTCESAWRCSWWECSSPGP